MGSFAMTCAISGLPIEAGDEVKFFLLTENPYVGNKNHNACYSTDWWFPRTFPIDGKYNDYGLVENIKKDFMTNLWLDGLKLDIIPQGIGDNQIHDISTSKYMSFKEFLDALQEGRIFVRQDVGMKNLKKDPNKKLPLYVPTLKNIHEIISDKLNVDDYLIDEKQHGAVRVRFSRFGNSIEQHINKLNKIKELMKQFSTVVKSGSGGNYAELMIYTPPNKEHHQVVDFNKDEWLKVSFAMVRLDVWQALLNINFNHLKKINSLVRKVYDNKDILYWKYPNEVYSLYKEEVPFTVDIATHWKIFLDNKLKIDDQELELFFNSVSEMILIKNELFHLRYMWRPSTISGVQFGEYDKHLEFFSQMFNIAETLYEKNTDDGYFVF